MLFSVASFVAWVTLYPDGYYLMLFGVVCFVVQVAFLIWFQVAAYFFLLLEGNKLLYIKQ